MAYVLWNKFLNVNPATSRHWSNRDRFVLSAGHGSALLYSLLHLAGYDLSIEDLKQFRQWGSKTPGHPEVNHTDGVEATTGPLGQGIANAVGMAMAEVHLATKFNKPGFDIVDHYTYALHGDGCLMEGVSQEAASLAGHLKLGKLVLLYDSNDISLDGPTSKAFTEDVKGKFEAYGWQHLLVEDGNDMEAIEAAIETAKAETNKPSIIEVKTIIGYGAEGQGTSAVHGAPIGQEGIDHAKSVYGMMRQPLPYQQKWQSVLNQVSKRVVLKQKQLGMSFLLNTKLSIQNWLLSTKRPLKKRVQKLSSRLTNLVQLLPAVCLAKKLSNKSVNKLLTSGVVQLTSQLQTTL